MVGSAWPQHFNRPIAEAMYTNIRAVGLPHWDEADQTLARAAQKSSASRRTASRPRSDRSPVR